MPMHKDILVTALTVPSSTPKISSPLTFQLNERWVESSSSSFDKAIKARFEECRARNILRTDPLASDVQRRRIPGKFGLVAEHEPTLFAKKRPATIPSNVRLDQPFNPEKFNFNKAKEEEVLLRVQFDPHEDGIHNIFVNVSPLMYGHGLLIPWARCCFPQRLTPEAVGLAISLLRQSVGCEFCVGFNSLGAFSSVNHLHLHILYPNELDHEARGAPLLGRLGFPIVHAPISRPVTKSYLGSCRVDLLDWMVPCLSFRPSANEGISDEDKVQVLRNAVSAFVTELHQWRIPHNVLFVNDTPLLRVIVIPRQPQHHFDASIAGFNAALGEISGLMIAKSQQHFDAFNENDIVQKMRRDVACKDDVLEELCLKLSIAECAEDRE